MKKTTKHNSQKTTPKAEKRTSNLIARTITGLVFVGVITGIPFLGLTAFRVLFLIIASLVAAELVKLIRESGTARLDPLSLSLLMVAAFVTTSMAATGMEVKTAVAATLLVLIASFIVQLYRKTPNPVNEMAYTVFVIAYAVVPFALLQFLALTADEAGNISYSPLFPLAMFAFIWANDTGAYCVGILAGKTKLFPRISPKKTWEGLIGGIAVSLATAYVFSVCFDDLKTYQWMGMALVVAVFATFGDLTESMIKRAWNVKDSGKILPGHGGVLDRFDSSLFAIPSTIIYLRLIELLPA